MYLWLIFLNFLEKYQVMYNEIALQHRWKYSNDPKV